MKSIINKIIYPVLLLTLVFFHACDEYLDKAPTMALNEEIVFTVFINAERYHNDLYSQLPQRFNAIGDFEPVPMACAADEADAPRGWHATQNFNMGNYAGGDNGFGFYESIRKANTFLSKKDIIPFPSDPKKNQMLGEVYFLRAFYFNEIIKRYGGMTIMDETNILYPGDELNKPRDSYKDCVEFMLKDLDQAISLLPVTLTENEYGRATQGAAMALKSRILLFAASPQWQKEMGQNLWQQAADAAKAVIDLTDGGSKVYELYNTGNGADDYERMFFLRREMGNKEIIFYKHEGTIGFGDNQIYVWAPKGQDLGGAGSVCPTQNFVDLFETNNGKLINEEGSGYNPQNPYFNREPRFYKIILYHGAQWQGKTMALNVGGANRLNTVEYTRTGYYVRKFLPEGVRNLTTNREYHNWIYFRLAEMYLNYAEALNETLGSPNQEVYNAVNTVRLRSGVVDLPAGLNKDQMRARIQNERAIELCFEEHRWWDVRRWQKGVDWFGGPMFEMEITLQGGQPLYNVKPFYNRTYRWYMDLYPITLGELRKNPLYHQNPGW